MTKLLVTGGAGFIAFDGRIGNQLTKLHADLVVFTDGAGDQRSVSSNLDAWQSPPFAPRVLVGSDAAARLGLREGSAVTVAGQSILLGVNAPNFATAYVMLDDFGFGQSSTFGGGSYGLVGAGAVMVVTRGVMPGAAIISTSSRSRGESG